MVKFKKRKEIAKKKEFKSLCLERAWNTVSSETNNRTQITHAGHWARMNDDGWTSTECLIRSGWVEKDQ